MHIFVACDTTGKPKYHGVPENDPSQPHICRVAVIAESAKDGADICLLVRPDASWRFEPGAVAFHGVDPEMCMTRGAPLQDVAQMIYSVMVRAAEPITIVAFGLDFQIRMLKRFFAEAHIIPPPPDGFDCMKESIALVKKPRTQPGGGYTNPNFAEAYSHFTGRALPEFRDMDPIEGGRAKVACVRDIYRGIKAARR